MNMDPFEFKNNDPRTKLTALRMVLSYRYRLIRLILTAVTIFGGSSLWPPAKSLLVRLLNS